MSLSHLKILEYSMPKKQWFPIEVGNEIVMNFLLSFISSLNFKLLFMPIEGNSGNVYSRRMFDEDLQLKTSVNACSIPFRQAVPHFLYFLFFTVKTWCSCSLSPSPNTSPSSFLEHIHLPTVSSNGPIGLTGTRGSACTATKQKTSQLSEVLNMVEICYMTNLKR